MRISVRGLDDDSIYNTFDGILEQSILNSLMVSGNMLIGNNINSNKLGIANTYLLFLRFYWSKMSN